MAAMKPRTGDGPMEAAKEGRGIVVRIPIEGGGRLVVELTPDEAAALGELGGGRREEAVARRSGGVATLTNHLVNKVCRSAVTRVKGDGLGTRGSGLEP